MIFDRKQQLNWQICPFHNCSNQERLVGWIRAEEICMKVGGNYLKYLKRGWNKKEGRGHKDFKKMGGGKLGHRVGALKRRGLKTTCKLWWCFYFYYCLLPCKNRRYSVFKDFPKVPIKQSCIHLHLAVPQDLIRIRSSRP